MFANRSHWMFAAIGDTPAPRHGDVTETAEPPLRLQLGADSVERIEAKPDLVRLELDQWRHVALSTPL
ncbi:hypothetical protein ACFQ6N_01410 [Kitasatospora sp. NPDC056446]|uniref:hypothetical protein n=1 Tax=Kitasatospora sp. NPDC056446 TaxID=3345819 RepID=UPI0036ABE272